jgi:pilus assembly protein CpaC
MSKIYRLVSLGLSLVFIGQLPLQAAPLADPDEKGPATPTTTAAPAASSVREPLIEVSVDSLEISEANVNALGILWGTSGTNGLQNGQLNFIEQSVPSIFDIGKLNRSAISAQLDLLIQNNQARILANPTLLTKSGFEANFLVGGEIPYPTVGQGGVQGVEYKKYGVSLKILPQLTPRQTIEAQINVGVSNPDNSVAITLNGISVPGLTSREAGSKVEVKDGETVVLAGIKQSRRDKTVIRVPILGYIPLLGVLFRHNNENTTQTSLVLFVTFRLIKS